MLKRKKETKKLGKDDTNLLSLVITKHNNLHDFFNLDILFQLNIIFLRNRIFDFLQSKKDSYPVLILQQFSVSSLLPRLLWSGSIRIFDNIYDALRDLVPCA